MIDTKCKSNATSTYAGMVMMPMIDLNHPK